MNYQWHPYFGWIAPHDSGLTSPDYVAARPAVRVYRVHVPDVPEPLEVSPAPGTGG